MLHAQVSYYSAFIQQHPRWQYGGVYADEALTGTKAARDGFQRLLKECRNGQIDQVITKSISRFARNSLITPRQSRWILLNLYHYMDSTSLLTEYPKKQVEFFSLYISYSNCYIDS